MKPGLAAARWSLLFGNFAIGCGVMVVPGTLTDIAQSLDVSVALAGQLIAMAAVVMCLGAPLLAGWVSGFDRRRLLVWSLAWYAVGHALCALIPGYAALLILRAVTVLAAAVFTPQAAAAVGAVAPPHERGRAITFIFLGWSLASVAGLPMASWLGDTFGWRTAFGFVAALAAIAAAWTFAALPDGVKPASLSVRAWKEVLTHPVLMAMVAVTALQGAGQFTLYSYIAPYFKGVLQATPAQTSLLFGWFGAFGVVGNVLLSRVVDRVGAGRAATFTISLLTVALALWPLASGIAMTAVLLVPWGLGFFASNSAQQARLGHAAPMLAPALMALNTSAIYLGQAAGAAGGGWLIQHGGFTSISWVGAAWTIVAIAVSIWVGRQVVQPMTHGPAGAA